MPKVLVLNGPNLNLLGTREPGLYGRDTLADIVARLRTLAIEMGHQLEALQSNSEGALIDSIHAAAQNDVAFIIINPAAYTHTSIALRDALLGVRIPFIEVHLSNVHAREDFRRQSYFSDAALGVICGFGAQGYEFALQAASRYLERQQ